MSRTVTLLMAASEFSTGGVCIILERRGDTESGGKGERSEPGLIALTYIWGG